MYGPLLANYCWSSQGGFSPATFSPSLWLESDRGLVTDGAAQFTAANSEYLSIADNATLRSGANSFWVAGWWKFTTLSSSHTLAAKWNTAANGWAVYADSGGFVNLTLNGTLRAATPGSTVTTANWYFVLAWYDAVNQTANIRLNNGTTYSASYGGGVTDAAVPFEIGTVGGIHLLDGLADSVAFGKSPPGGIAAIISTISGALYNSGAGLVYDDLSAAQKTDWGLVSWWNLDEASGTRYDAHGTNHLTDNNTVTYAGGVAAGNALTDGLPGKAAQFTAANNEYLSIADNATFPSGNIDAWWGGWFYLDTSVGTHALLTQYGAVGNRQLFLFLNGAALTFDISGDGTAVTEFSVAGGIAGAWHFFLTYHDAANDLLGLSIDGGAFTTAAHSSGLFNSTAAFTLGQTNSGVGYMDGRMDSVCFGKSPPAGIAGIAATIRDSLYNSGRGKSYSALTAAEKTDWGLVSFWDLEESSGTREDAHGSNDLTDNNTVTQADGVAEILGQGNPVSLWEDLSGNGNSPAQLVGTKRLAVRVNAQNGLAGLLSDGSDDQIVTPSFAHFPSKRGTIVLAWNPEAANIAALSTFSGAAVAFQLQWVMPDGHYRWYDNSSNVTLESSAGGDPAILVIRRTGDTTLNFRRNGVDKGDATIADNQPSAFALSLAGDNGGVGEYVSAYYFAVLEFDRDLSTAEVEQIEQYLNSKLAIY